MLKLFLKNLCVEDSTTELKTTFCDPNKFEVMIIVYIKDINN